MFQSSQPCVGPPSVGLRPAIKCSSLNMGPQITLHTELCKKGTLCLKFTSEIDKPHGGFHQDSFMSHEDVQPVWRGCDDRIMRRLEEKKQRPFEIHAGVQPRWRSAASESHQNVFFVLNDKQTSKIVILAWRWEEGRQKFSDYLFLGCFYLMSEWQHHISAHALLRRMMSIRVLPSTTAKSCI